MTVATRSANSGPLRAAHRLASMQKQLVEASNVCASMEKEYPWITSEKQHFGRPGTDYDWEAKDPTKVLHRLHYSPSDILFSSHGSLQRDGNCGG